MCESQQGLWYEVLDSILTTRTERVAERVRIQLRSNFLVRDYIKPLVEDTKVEKIPVDISPTDQTLNLWRCGDWLVVL